MSPFDRPRVLDLHDGELLRCTRPMRLRVLAGRVWLTRADDLDDHFLAAGDVVRLAPARREIAGADGAARVLIAPDRAALPGAGPLRAAAGWARRAARGAFTMALPLLGSRTPWTSPPTSSP